MNHKRKEELNDHDGLWLVAIVAFIFIIMYLISNLYETGTKL